MEFEIISEELIRPSSPTPTHLKTYKFSLLDQFLGPIYTPLILFYPPNHNLNSSSSLSLLLKQSLSETLSQFYPVAGKLKDALSIDCNDEGLHYTNARVTNISLSDYLNQTDLPSMFTLLPKSKSIFQQGEGHGFYVCFVQQTCFPCGGLAIGLQVLHFAMDGISMVSFLKAWAENTSLFRRGSFNVSVVEGSSIFPPFDDFPTLEMITVLLSSLRKGKFGTRRFLFEASDIDRLKEKAKSSSTTNPTRVEVVSSLLLQRIKIARKATSVAITYPVNIRTRFDPPLPKFSMGNLIWFIRKKMDETELTGLVSHLRKAFRGVDVEFVKNIKGCDREFLKGEVEKLKDMGSETEYIACTSWVNFGVYEIDFGWGKPLWVSSVNEATSGDLEIPFTTAINLMDAKMGKGIEVYVHSLVEVLSELEKDEELLSYASLNPSPLK